MKYRVMLAGGKGFWVFLHVGAPGNAPLTALLDDSPGSVRYAGHLLSDVGPDRDPRRAAELARNWFYRGGANEHEIVSVEETRIRPRSGQTRIMVENWVDYDLILGKPFASAALVLEFRAEDIRTGPIVLRTAEIDGIRGDTAAGDAWKAATVSIDAQRPVGEECMAGRAAVGAIIHDLRPRIEAWWELDQDDPDWTRRADEFRAWFAGRDWTDGRRRRELRGVSAPEHYAIACDGPIVIGDLIRWAENVLSEEEGARPPGPRTVEGEVRGHRVATDVADDTLLIRVDEAEGVDPPCPDDLLTRRHLDLLEIGCRRAEVDEAARAALVTHSETARAAAREGAEMECEKPESVGGHLQ